MKHLIVVFVAFLLSVTAFVSSPNAVASSGWVESFASMAGGQVGHSYLTTIRNILESRETEASITSTITREPDAEKQLLWLRQNAVIYHTREVEVETPYSYDLGSGPESGVTLQTETRYSPDYDQLYTSLLSDCAEEVKLGEGCFSFDEPARGVQYFRSTLCMEEDGDYIQSIEVGTFGVAS